MDEVDRAIAKFENTVVVYDLDQLSSVGDYSRRGSTTSFNFNWRSPLGLLQKKKKEVTQLNVLSRDAQMESVIFDFTDDDDLRCSFRDLQLRFLEDDEALEAVVPEESPRGNPRGSRGQVESQDAIFTSSVGIHGKPWSTKRMLNHRRVDNDVDLHNFGNRGTSSLGVDVTEIMPLTGQSDARLVERRPRRKSLNPTSWWRH